MTRGITVVATMTSMMESAGSAVLPANVFQAQVVGWCIEWLQACFLVLDDIMDESITRRGQPCWYKLPEVGKMAINDGLILETCIYLLLGKHLKSHPAYHRLVHLFHEVSMQTEMGQLLDMTTEAPGGGLDFSRFTIERYKLIVKYKTAFYSFYLPVAAGLILAGLEQEEAALEEARGICLALGEYFQIQDDVLDCFGKPEDIGKVGTDIQDKKCSWLVVTALGKCSPAQLQVLKDNYGAHDDAKVEAVKGLYRELGLEADFAAYEDRSYKELVAAMEEVRHVPKSVFQGLLAKIYKRTK